MDRKAVFLGTRKVYCVGLVNQKRGLREIGEFCEGERVFIRNGWSFEEQNMWMTLFL